MNISGLSNNNIPIMGEIKIKHDEVLMWNERDWVPIQMESNKYSKTELLDEFEKNPELFNEIMIEMRKRKINKIIK